MDQVLSAEDVAVETERKRNQAGGDGEDLNAADAKEDEAQHEPHGEAELLLVGLVAEEIEDQRLNPGVTQHEISPGEEREDRQRERGVKVGVRRADGVEPVAIRALKLDRADSGEEAAPVHQEDENEKAAEDGEGLADHLLADNRLEGVAQAGGDILDEGLALVGDDLRSADKHADGDDDEDRENPGGQDRVGDRDAADLKEVGRLRIDAFSARESEGWGKETEEEKRAHLDAGKDW